MKVYCPQNMFSPCEHTNRAKRFCCLLPWDSSTNRNWNEQRHRLWPLRMCPGRLRRKELDRLDILSLSPHSIKDFPFVYSPKTERFKAIQRTPWPAQLLRLSACLTILGLYKSAIPSQLHPSSILATNSPPPLFLHRSGELLHLAASPWPSNHQ
jgi:hypothetical protein